MVTHFLVIMGFQLAGEAIVAWLGTSFPGSLCGMLLVLIWLWLRRGPSEELTGASRALIDYLGLLFVPAGAAVMGFGALLLSDGVAIAASLILSTGLAIPVGGLVFGARHALTLERSGGQQ